MNDWNLNDFIMVLLIIAAVLFIIFYVYTLVVYGNKPVTEIPTWVWWLLHSS